MNETEPGRGDELETAESPGPEMLVSPQAARALLRELFAPDFSCMKQENISRLWDMADSLLNDDDLVLPATFRSLLESYQKAANRAFGGEAARVQFKRDADALGEAATPELEAVNLTGTSESAHPQPNEREKS